MKSPKRKRGFSAAIVDLNDLVTDPANARKHTERNATAVKRSLQAFGAARSVVIDGKGVVRAGNQTVEQARQAGIKRAIVIETDGKQLVVVKRKDWSQVQGVAYGIADNRSTDLSEWDRAALASQTQALKAEGMDLGVIGFDPDELESVLQTGEKDPSPEPEPQAPDARPITQPGDLWLLGQHRLLCGDATNPEAVALLMHGKRAHLINTDPPYGVNYESSKCGKLKNDDRRDDALVDLLLPAFKNAVEHARDGAAFYIWHASGTRRDFQFAMEAAGIEERQYITWVKDQFVLGRSHYQWQTEPCFYGAKAGQLPIWHGDRCESTVWRVEMHDGQGRRLISLANGVRISDGSHREIFISPAAPKAKRTRLMRLRKGDSIAIANQANGTDAWQISQERADCEHPTQKPTALAIRAIHNSTAAGDLVLDLFAGGGFTLLGCEATGRKARAMELDPKFCDLICRRWMLASGQMPQRERDGAAFDRLAARRRK